MTLGNAVAAKVRLIVWFLDCRHQIEADPAKAAERYGAEMTVPDWQARLMCSKCRSAGPIRGQLNRAADCSNRGPAKCKKS
jgi:hypothetical protein